MNAAKDCVAGALALACVGAVVLATARDAVAGLGPAGPAAATAAVAPPTR